MRATQGWVDSTPSREQVLSRSANCAWILLSAVESSANELPKMTLLARYPEKARIVDP